MPQWPDPPFTDKESKQLASFMESQPADAAKLLDTTPGQAAALQRYVLLACAVRMHERRGIPCAHKRVQAKGIMRCLSPALKNWLPEGLRFAL